MSHLCIKPACGEACIDCACALPPETVKAFAVRYAWLRHRDLHTIKSGGVFAGMTPQNVVLNGADLDEAIDAGMEKEQA
jgi:hypothetical protein